MAAKHLRLPLFFGRKISRHWEDLVHKVQSKVTGWKRKVLSKTERAILISLMGQLMPLCGMSTFSLPASTCKDIDYVLRRFWWGVKV